MKKLLFTLLSICLGVVARAEYNVTSVIYDGNGQECAAPTANVGGVAEETLVEMQMLSDDQIITGATEYLEMT